MLRYFSNGEQVFDCGGVIMLIGDFVGWLEDREAERVTKSQELREFLFNMEPYSILYNSDIQDWIDIDLQLEEINVSGTRFFIDDDSGCATLDCDAGQVIFHMISSIDFGMYCGSQELFYIDLVCYSPLEELSKKTYKLYGKKILGGLTDAP